MIGIIRYEDDDGDAVTATLREDGTWAGDVEDDVRTLDLLTGVADRSPARGNWLAWHAGRMAAMLGGTLELEPKDPIRPERRY